MNMTKCVNCGTEAENASFCPECGAMIIRETISQAGAPSVEPAVAAFPNAEPVPEQAPVYSSDTAASSNAGDINAYSVGSDNRTGFSGESPMYAAPVYQPAPGVYPTRPSGSGQMVFAVINIVLGTIMCCCFGLGIPALVLAIIAAVMASGANKAITAEEAESKIKTARILNIISIILAVVAIVIAIAFSVWSSNIDTSEYYSQYGYDFSSMFGS
jgi:hypothetical protein